MANRNCTYLEKFGLTSNPFQEYKEYQKELFFWSRECKKNIDLITNLISYSDDIIFITGDKGSGKTYFALNLVDQVSPNVKFLYIEPSLIKTNHVFSLVSDLVNFKHTDLQTSIIYQDFVKHLYNLDPDTQHIIIIDDIELIDIDSIEVLFRLFLIKSDKSSILKLIALTKKLTNEIKNLLKKLNIKTKTIELNPLTRVDLDSYIKFKLSACGCQSIIKFSNVELDKIFKCGKGNFLTTDVCLNELLCNKYSKNDKSIHLRKFLSNAGLLTLFGFSAIAIFYNTDKIYQLSDNINLHDNQANEGELHILTGSSVLLKNRETITIECDSNQTNNSESTAVKDSSNQESIYINDNNQFFDFFSTSLQLSAIQIPTDFGQEEIALSNVQAGLFGVRDMEFYAARPLRIQSDLTRIESQLLVGRTLFVRLYNQDKKNYLAGIHVTSKYHTAVKYIFINSELNFKHSKPSIAIDSTPEYGHNSSSLTQYTIQLISTTNKSQALSSLYSEMKSYNANIFETKKNGIVFYTVTIGIFNTRQDAEDYAKLKLVKRDYWIRELPSQPTNSNQATLPTYTSSITDSSKLLETDKWFIQLGSYQKPDSIIDLNMTNQKIVEFSTNGSKRYLSILGPYSTRISAQEILEKLPNRIKMSKPFIRNSNEINRLILSK
jgi:type II secretory pathway predicted ATPase ExeA